ncbi:protein N-lysine methyltransferase FAM173A isoform X2 [Takifugu rubripes]|uniref:protein N-lysine methyltransferase FAM173A isoform X2 n=1 Tax=Takifugu rubripes TaxID=31033 RepID=UPI00114553E0|nr:protein N-lysine methyltransferase FAM173A-like isoform X2 [Takifugu rubripes]
MEDSIDVILEDHTGVLSPHRPHPAVSACLGALFTAVYGVWSTFALPGLGTIPRKLKVPYLPSSRVQTLNIMKLLEGRTGVRSLLHCFEINSILVAYARNKARWNGLPTSQAAFVNKDFWKTDLSHFNNVTAFLAPGVMAVLSEKLLKELPDDARVISCRFPILDWPVQSSVGSGLDQTFAYDIGIVRAHLRKAPEAEV